MHNRLAFLSVVSLGLTSFAGAALTIVPTYDASVTNDSRSASIESAFNYAANQIAGLYTDSIHVNILVKLAPGTGTLGQSNTPVLTNQSFNSTLRPLLVADAKSLDDATALVDDYTSAIPDRLFFVTRAQAKAIGGIADDNVTDGTVTFGAGWNYTFDPNNRAVGGTFDFIGVAQHEISEVMGRIAALGALNNDDIYDLTRFSAPGTRGLNTGGGNYFSINGGATNLRGFNNADANGGDAADWDNASLDACNAFLDFGQQVNFTETDARVMDVIGYDRVPVPEPASILPFGILAGGLFLRRSRRKA